MVGRHIHVRGVAGGIGDNQRVHAARGAAHHFLGDVAAQAEPDQHHRLGGWPLQQGEDVSDRGLVEPTRGLAMGPQIGDHGLEAVLQGVDLRSPGVWSSVAPCSRTTVDAPALPPIQYRIVAWGRTRSCW